MILLLGNTKKVQAFATRVSQGNIIKEIQYQEIELYKNDTYELVVDLDFDSDPLNRWITLQALKTNAFILGSSLCQLGTLPLDSQKEKVFGICNLPGFIERETLEYSAPFCEEMPAFITQKMNYSQFLKVEDRVGMISPRIICMIINEAYFTLQEGTASKKDIDLGMKLGTAYPYGPFEWSNLIGLENVYNVLKAVFNDTMDERYKICNLLKTEALSKVV